MAIARLLKGKYYWVWERHEWKPYRVLLLEMLDHFVDLFCQLVFNLDGNVGRSNL